MPKNRKWEFLRVDIETIIRENDIPEAEFKALSIHDGWDKIEENIYHTFCQLDHPRERPIWLWEYFKLDTSHLIVEFPYAIVEQLIDHSEEVWFFVNGDKDKFWFYQGKIRAILKIIAESSYIDELYISSKKYDWLLCINHHDCLIATGNLMPDRLRHLSGIEL